jgi:gas vesicle protein
LFLKLIKHKLQSREQKGEFKMANNQINPNQEPNDNQLTDEELEQVAGGNIFGDIADAVEDTYNDVKEDVTNWYDDVKHPFKK